MFIFLSDRSATHGNLIYFFFPIDTAETLSVSPGHCKNNSKNATRRQKKNQIMYALSTWFAAKTTHRTMSCSPRATRSRSVIQRREKAERRDGKQGCLLGEKWVYTCTASVGTGFYLVGRASRALECSNFQRVLLPSSLEASFQGRELALISGALFLQAVAVDLQLLVLKEYAG